MANLLSQAAYGEPSSIGIPFPRRGLVMSFLHIYWDESGKYKSSRVICLAALCIRSSSLNAFEDQWHGLLSRYSLTELHMVEVSRLSQTVGSKFIKGQTFDERVELLKPFADCVNDHVERGLVHICDSEGFDLIPKKQRLALANLNDPYHMALIRGIEEVSRYGGDDWLAIVCDDDEETAWESYEKYRALRKPRVAVRDKVKSISFADSATFRALQAADMISYLGKRQGEFEWCSKPFELQALLAYITSNPVPAKTDWRVARFDKGTLANAKNWRAQ